MPGKILPYPRFLEIAAVVPWPVIDFLVIRGDELYLLLRESNGPDKSYSGMWHLPGGYVLAGEEQDEFLRRLILKELGLEHSLAIALRFGGFVHNNPHEERGHLIHMPWVVEFPEGMLPESEKARFFRIYQLPDNTIRHHLTIVSRYLASK